MDSFGQRTERQTKCQTVKIESGSRNTWATILNKLTLFYLGLLQHEHNNFSYSVTHVCVWCINETSKILFVLLCMDKTGSEMRAPSRTRTWCECTELACFCKPLHSLGTGNMQDHQYYSWDLKIYNIFNGINIFIYKLQNTRVFHKLKNVFAKLNEIKRIEHKTLFTLCKRYTLLFNIVPMVVKALKWDKFLNSHVVLLCCQSF